MFQETILIILFLYYRKEVDLIKVSSEDLINLKKVIKNEKNQDMVVNLVSEVLGLNVRSVKFDTIKKFENISEYEFSAIKVQCDLELEENVDVYFKIIKKDKIKESLFCYWCLLYEQALKENKDKITMATLISKVLISEIGMERYKNSVFLEIKDNKTDILKYGTEVHFIDFIKYIEKHKSNNNDLEKWLKYIDGNSKDIFMMGVVLNKDIGRSNISIV